MSKKEDLYNQYAIAKAELARQMDTFYTNPFANLGMANTYDGGLAAVMSEEQRARHRARLDETRELKGRFSDYATDDIDVTSPCERLPDDYQQHLDSLEWTESERAWWRHLDAAMQSGKPPF
jgi:hypothetical protein